MVKLSFNTINNIAKLRPPGYIDDIIDNSTSITTDDNNNILYVELTDEKYEYLKIKYRSNYLSPLSGVGTQLKKLLSKLGIQASTNCDCNKHAKQMDDNGIEWCENNKETIIDWLEIEAKKRRIPFIRYAALVLINKAIKNAKKFK